jgi:hypothetical protein
MSGGPLAKVSVLDGLIAHLAASLQIDPSDKDELAGIEHLALSAANYFASSVRGAPTGGAQTLQWALMSALWEGKLPQQDIDNFFEHVNLDLGKLISAWRQFSPEDQKGVMSVVLIPGKLDEATIMDVTAALYRNIQK